jgi:hypothetical protein
MAEMASYRKSLNYRPLLVGMPCLVAALQAKGSHQTISNLDERVNDIGDKL